MGEERRTSYCLIRSPYRPWNVLRDNFKQEKWYGAYCGNSTHDKGTNLAWVSCSWSQLFEHKDSLKLPEFQKKKLPFKFLIYIPWPWILNYFSKTLLWTMTFKSEELLIVTSLFTYVRSWKSLEISMSQCIVLSDCMDLHKFLVQIKFLTCFWRLFGLRLFAYFNAIGFLCGKVFNLHLFCVISMFVSGRMLI